MRLNEEKFIKDRFENKIKGYVDKKCEVFLKQKHLTHLV